jgi:hypothetical protein
MVLFQNILWIDSLSLKNVVCSQKSKMVEIKMKPKLKMFATATAYQHMDCLRPLSVCSSIIYHPVIHKLFPGAYTIKRFCNNL